MSPLVLKKLYGLLGKSNESSGRDGDGGDEDDDDDEDDSTEQRKKETNKERMNERKEKKQASKQTTKNKENNSPPMRIVGRVLPTVVRPRPIPSPVAVLNHNLLSRRIVELSKESEVAELTTPGVSPGQNKYS